RKKSRARPARRTRRRGRHRALDPAQPRRGSSCRTRLMYLLDTNVVSELRKVRSGRADVGVAAWAEQTRSAEMFVSAITIHDLEHGVRLLERADPEQGAVLRAWLDRSVAAAFADRVLAVDDAVARRAALLHVPDPAPFRDALIGG